MKLSEILFLLSGVAILASVPFVYLAGNFAVWVAAKVFYAVGLLLFVKYS